MLVKHPKPQYRKWLKRGALIVFVVEAVAFAASYYGWSKVNTDRESRKYLKNNYPSLLEVYYKSGELFDSSSKIRELDQAYWNAESKTQTLFSALMEPSRLVKSVFWLTSFTGFGYLLFLALTGHNQSYKDSAKDYPGFDRDSKQRLNKTEQFVNVLEAASRSDKPFYRLSKEEIDNIVKK